jgi:hypothetical protein
LLKLWLKSKNVSNPKQVKKALKFFEYLEQLAKHSSTIGYSNQTPEYYKSIDEACDTYLKLYAKKPIVMLQILGWSQRLMHYYLLDTSKLDDEIDSLQIDEGEEAIISTPKLPKADKAIKSTATAIEAPQTLKPSPQPPKPISPEPIKPTQTVNPPTLTRPTPHKPTKTAENPKLEKPKAPEPKQSWARPPKPPKK